MLILLFCGLIPLSYLTDKLYHRNRETPSFYVNFTEPSAMFSLFV